MAGKDAGPGRGRNQGATVTLTARRRALQSPLPDGNTGANPGLSRNCHRGATLHHATACGLEGGGEHRSGSQDTGGPREPRGWRKPMVAPQTAPASSTQPLYVPLAAWLAVAVAALLPPRSQA